MSNDSITGDISTADCEPDARIALEGLLALLGTRRPGLRELWLAMDLVWDLVGADNRNPTPDALARFYSHPIWLLNGLFIEQHAESLRYRERFADWVQSVRPVRVADYGGGFGTLARKIGARCPTTLVEIVEPFPRSEAIRANEASPNVRFVPELSDVYDVAIATDVFEHVETPVDTLFHIARFIRPGGYFLVANHFAPSIKCHLPSTFHLNETWPLFMALAGFQRVTTIDYAGVYQKTADRTLSPQVRRAEANSALSYRLARRIRGAGRLRALWYRLATPASSAGA